MGKSGVVSTHRGRTLSRNFCVNWYYQRAKWQWPVFFTAGPSKKSSNEMTGNPRNRPTAAWPVCLLALASFASISEARDVFGAPLAPEEVRTPISIHISDWMRCAIRDFWMNPTLCPPNILPCPCFPLWSCFPYWYDLWLYATLSQCRGLSLSSRLVAGCWTREVAESPKRAN